MRITAYVEMAFPPKLSRDKRIGEVNQKLFQLKFLIEVKKMAFWSPAQNDCKRTWFKSQTAWVEFRIYNQLIGVIIVIGNRHSDPSSIPRQGCLHFTEH